MLYDQASVVKIITPRTHIHKHFGLDWSGANEKKTERKERDSHTDKGRQ